MTGLRTLDAHGEVHGSAQVTRIEQLDAVGTGHHRVAELCRQTRRRGHGVGDRTPFPGRNADADLQRQVERRPVAGLVRLANVTLAVPLPVA